MSPSPKAGDANCMQHAEAVKLAKKLESLGDLSSALAFKV